MTLFDNLQAIAHMVKSNLPKMKNNEDATINVSVSPFIRALGYSTQDLDEVYPQYPILNTDAVDYAILRDDMPVIFVEAKSAGNKLQNKEWKQLFQYFNAEIGLRFGILTNGVEYRFYTDLKADNIMDKEPFLTLDMLNLNERLVKELEAFTKSSFDPDRIKAGAQKQVILGLLKQEMDRPSNALVKHFAGQVHSGRLHESDIHRYARLLRVAWLELLDREVASRLELIDVGGQPQSESKQKSLRPNLPSLPATGDVHVPIYGELKKGKYAGHRFEAVLLVNEAIYFKQKVVLFHSIAMTPSGAARSGFEKAIGEHPDVNGWWFWKLTDPDSGDERPIDHVVKDEDLRNRILKNV